MKKTKGFFAEFKQFAVKGNVMDLAVGVIIGGAFSKIVTSLVNDIIMPFVGIFIGADTFAGLSLAIGPSVINIGLFIQAVIDFLILAFVVFLMVRGINLLRSKEKTPDVPKAPPEPTKEELLLTEIRDILKAGK
ncbi:Large-conductance mechanosensitive channel [bioreactor metagenome]|uniref:Large-conductance mechanosensitive channel n=1 Tax=bioreactor metagenome TaxID=1076179 RepID=A0A644WTY4_9ZZZZ